MSTIFLQKETKEKKSIDIIVKKTARKQSLSGDKAALIVSGSLHV